MQKALYFPHTDIRNPTIIKNALLLWDSVETIVPHRRWISSGRNEDKLYREAVELVVTRRVPNNQERAAAHDVLEDLERSGVLSSMVRQSPSHWRQERSIGMEKFAELTWHLFERANLARRIADDYYGVHTPVGFIMMSVLADVCAGTQIQKITDRAEAYRWIATHHAKLLGSRYVTGLDVSQVRANAPLESGFIVDFSPHIPGGIPFLDRTHPYLTGRF